MKFSFLTTQASFFIPFFEEGLFGKAIAKGVLQAQCLSLRDFASPPHYRVDDRPYGGGPGMVLKIEPIVKALRFLEKENERGHRVLLSAKGEAFAQDTAKRWSSLSHLIFICGRYEGVDERVAEHVADEEVRLGDAVLMGGEAPAMAMAEAVARFIPGVLGNEDSLKEESFASPLWTQEYGHYTRPPEFEGFSVPEVLLSGDHDRIRRWRLERSKK